MSELTRGNSNALTGTRRERLAPPDFPFPPRALAQAARSGPSSVPANPYMSGAGAGCRPAAAVRSTPRPRGAGSGAQRFIAASPLRAIRTDRIGHGGAGRDGCRRSQPLLAAGAARDERSDASRRAKPDAAGRHPAAGHVTRRSCAKTDQNAAVEALVVGRPAYRDRHREARSLPPTQPRRKYTARSTLADACWRNLLAKPPTSPCEHEPIAGALFRNLRLAARFSV